MARFLIIVGRGSWFVDRGSLTVDRGSLTVGRWPCTDATVDAIVAKDK
jgi:hypothetical protein